MKKVCIMGLGYIGLPTAIVLADAGFHVIGFDVDASRVAKLLTGDPVIQEPDIAHKLHTALRSGNFCPTTIIQPADFFVIAVPTPFKDGKKADISYVESAIDMLAPVVQPGNVVIIESTIPVGTTNRVALQLQQRTGFALATELFVAHCPERVLPGKIFHELVYNARIIGGVDQASMQAAKELYTPFVKGDLYLTDATTAEMVKLVENSSRDVSIAFAHQVASMAYAVGLNPYEVIELANKHPRVNILTPSCGVGGHCIAVDPWFLVETFPHHTKLLKAARNVNDRKPSEVVRTVKKAIYAWRKKHNDVCTIALFGATYKANVDDLRESPALQIIRTFAQWYNLNVLVVEPHVNADTLKNLIGSAVQIVSVEQALQQADIMVYLVAHSVFSTSNVNIAHKIVIDVCGIKHQAKITLQGNEHLFWPAQTTPYEYVHQVGQASGVMNKEYP